MSLTNNRRFLLASAQLFPVMDIEPVESEVSDEALTQAKKAFFHFKQGEIKEALELYTDAIQRFPDQPFFYASRSILNMVSGDEEGAFYDYQVAKGLDLNYQAFLEWLENRPDEEREFRKYTSLMAIHEAALEAVQQFDYKQAQRLYTDAHERYPEDAVSLVFRAASHIRLLQYDKALLDLNKAIDRDTDYFDAYLVRAKLYKAVQALEEARADFDRSIALGPKAAIAFEERGDFFVEMKDYDAALQDFNELVALLPEDFYVYTLRADLLEKIENWEGALQDYSMAISLNPYYSDLYAYRAEMKERLGDTTGAAEDRRMFEELEQEEE